MLNRKMMQSWTLCRMIKPTTSSSKHHLELQAKMWIARPCLVLGDPAPATVRRPSTKSIFEKSASFWESSCGFQTFICLQNTSLLPKPWEGVKPFLQTEATRMVSTEAGLGSGVVHPSLLLPSPEQEKNWLAMMVWLWSVLCLNHIIFICRNKDTCLKGTKGWCLTEGRIR